jgi:pimeloyl-ACP methyl ester carboxylesterase
MERIMRTRLAALMLVSSLVLAACGAPSPADAPPGSSPSGASPAAAANTGPRAVTFTSDDGITLSGTLYGSGASAVVFSHMFPTDQTSWTLLAQDLAGRGYMVLTYDFRGYGKSQGAKEVSKIDHDLRAAVAFVRAQGATRLVLVGASMGGMATAKVAAVENPAAVVIMSAPQSFAGLVVSDDEVKAISAPKLFIGSEQDGATSATLHMAEVASAPKDKYIYPGSGHGTYIFDTKYGADLTQRIIQFIETNTR